MRPASQMRHRAMRQAQAGFHAAQLEDDPIAWGTPAGCNSSAPGPSPASGSSGLKHLETQTARSCTEAAAERRQRKASSSSRNSSSSTSGSTSSSSSQLASQPASQLAGT